MLALWMGYGADLIFGDPHWLPHPVRWIGKGISILDKILRPLGKTPRKKKAWGVVLLMSITGVSFVVPFVLLKILGRWPWLQLILETIMIYQILATRCLALEAEKVAGALEKKDLSAGKRAVSFLVSRDTDVMEKTDVIKATVETITENIIDGIVSPLIYIAIGGAPLGWAFKAINTLDSMVGYKNETYKDFGWASARFDDVVNFIPARITAGLILVATALLGFDVKRAWKILKRDGKNHASPNSPLSEATAAGALNIELGGQASYFGVVSQKPTMGDNIEKPEVKHIRGATKLMYVSSFLCLVFVTGLNKVILLFGGKWF